MLPADIQLITFDLDGTLWCSDRALQHAEHVLYDWVAEHCPEAASLYSMKALAAYKRDIAQSYPAIAHQTSHLRKRVLERLFLQTRMSRPEAIEMAEAAFAVFYQARSQVDVFPEARTVLETLATSYPLIAITNGNADLDLIGLNHVFTHWLKADDFERAKPAPDMFQHALTLMQVKPEQTVHIGDHPVDDIQAAKTCGLNTVWMNKTQSAWPKDVAKADQTISELNQLLSLL